MAGNDAANCMRGADFFCQAIPQDDTKFWRETMQGGIFLRASLAHLAALADVYAAVAPTLRAR